MPIEGVNPNFNKSGLGPETKSPNPTNRQNHVDSLYANARTSSTITGELIKSLNEADVKAIEDEILKEFNRLCGNDHMISVDEYGADIEKQWHNDVAKGATDEGFYDRWQPEKERFMSYDTNTNGLDFAEFKEMVYNQYAEKYVHKKYGI